MYVYLDKIFRVDDKDVGFSVISFDKEINNKVKFSNYKMNNLEKFFDDFNIDECIFDFTIKDGSIRQLSSVTNNCDYDSLKISNLPSESFIKEEIVESTFLVPYFSLIEDFINKEVIFLGDNPKIDPSIIHNNFKELKFSDSSMSVYFSCFNIETRKWFFKKIISYNEENEIAPKSFYIASPINTKLLLEDYELEPVSFDTYLDNDFKIFHFDINELLVKTDSLLFSDTNIGLCSSLINHLNNDKYLYKQCLKVLTTMSKTKLSYNVDKTQSPNTNRKNSDNKSGTFINLMTPKPNRNINSLIGLLNNLSCISSKNLVDLQKHFSDSNDNSVDAIFPLIATIINNKLPLNVLDSLNNIFDCVDYYTKRLALVSLYLYNFRLINTEYRDYISYLLGPMKRNINFTGSIKKYSSIVRCM